MKTSEFLNTAKGFIEKGWTQNAFARQKHGKREQVDSPKACKWCVHGAIQAAWHIHVADKDNVVQRALVNAAFSDANKFFSEAIDSKNAIAYWNDAPGRTQAEVIEAFNRAIAIAKKQEG